MTLLIPIGQCVCARPTVIPASPIRRTNILSGMCVKLPKSSLGVIIYISACIKNISHDFKSDAFVRSCSPFGSRWDLRSTLSAPSFFGGLQCLFRHHAILFDIFFQYKVIHNSGLYIKLRCTSQGKQLTRKFVAGIGLRNFFFKEIFTFTFGLT